MIVQSDIYMLNYVEKRVFHYNFIFSITKNVLL